MWPLSSWGGGYGKDFFCGFPKPAINFADLHTGAGEIFPRTGGGVGDIFVEFNVLLCFRQSCREGSGFGFFFVEF